VASLGLGHDEHVPGPRELAQAIGFGTGNIDGAGLGELGMVDVEDLVAEPLQAAFGDGDEADRNVEIGQPEGSLGQVFDMLEVYLDILAPPNAPECGDEPDRGLRFDHARSFAKEGECRRY
jgi:hypothetical protein